MYTDSYLDKTTDKASALQAELIGKDTNATVSASGNKLSVKYRGKDKVLDVSAGTVSDSITVAKAKKDGIVFDDNTSITDTYGNTFIVPKGFKLASDSAENVTEGIVIEDATYTNTKGSEFVWIPVSKDSTDKNKVKGAKNTTILLRRYVFDSNGNVDATLSKSDPQDQLNTYYTEGLKDSTIANAHAKDIEDFISKTNAAGGFYIGRYEVRIEGYTGNVATSNSNNETSWTGYTGGKLVEKPGAQVFNYITQNKASELSRKMYEKENDGTTAITKFESDLINSYAWDTATLFLQEYDNRTNEVKDNPNYKAKYSNQIRLSTGMEDTGTNNLSVEANKDKICNVYDMAGNCWEWSTETSSAYGYPCVPRGGTGNNSSNYTSIRLGGTTTLSFGYGSFRPVLYIK